MMVVSLLRIGVLIRFMVENTHSVSAEEAGNTIILASSLEMRGYAVTIVLRKVGCHISITACCKVGGSNLETKD